MLETAWILLFLKKAFCISHICLILRIHPFGSQSSEVRIVSSSKSVRLVVQGKGLLCLWRWHWPSIPWRWDGSQDCTEAGLLIFLPCPHWCLGIGSWASPFHMLYRRLYVFICFHLLLWKRNRLRLGVQVIRGWFQVGLSLLLFHLFTLFRITGWRAHLWCLSWKCKNPALRFRSECTLASPPTSSQGSTYRKFHCNDFLRVISPVEHSTDSSLLQNSSSSSASDASVSLSSIA